MKIYEAPKCEKKDCTNSAICLYAGTWICGPHVQEFVEKDRARKREMFLNG